MAFHDMGRRAARALLVHNYGEVFDEANVNPAATVENEGEIIRYMSDYSAEVRTSEGLRVKTSSVPLRIIQQANGTVKYVGANAEVILNSNREVVTAWATSKAGWRVQP